MLLGPFQIQRTDLFSCYNGEFIAESVTKQFVLRLKMQTTPTYTYKFQCLVAILGTFLLIAATGRFYAVIKAFLASYQAISTSEQEVLR